MHRSFLVLLAATALTACSGNRGEGGDSGPRAARDFEVTGFTQIVVAGPFDVTVAVGGAPTMRAEGPQRLLDATVAEVRDGRLTIRTEQRSWLNNIGGDPARVTITLPALSAATIAGAGDLTIDRVSGERFEGTVAGAGDLDIGQVAVKALRLRIAGAGDVRARGQAERADYVVAGTGDLDASELTVREAEARVAGAGNIRARVTGTARTTVAGVGDIEISGGATCEQRKSGIGDIRCS